MGFYRLSANIDRLTTKTSEKDPENSKISFPFDQNSTENLKVQSNSQNKSIPQSSEACNESTLELNPKETSSSAKPKRSSLTARERLRAARVLSRYNETKPSRSDMGKVLDAIKESERGKKKGLPEAPGNLFDDSNRGVSKPGLSFEFPGGNDLFIIVFSFVFISTVMFATTYIVWKVGAIHFNEY